MDGHKILKRLRDEEPSEGHALGEAKRRHFLFTGAALPPEQTQLGRQVNDHSPYHPAEASTSQQANVRRQDQTEQRQDTQIQQHKAHDQAGPSRQGDILQALKRK